MLKANTALAISKMSLEDTGLKANKKKLKSSLEEFFSKGKRLPVFTDITVDKAAKKAKPGKSHVLNKMKSEQI